MSKKSRERHLAKQAARRQAERREKRRQRSTAIGIGVGLGAAVIAVLAVALTRGGNEAASPSSSASPTPEAVACGAKVPKAAAVTKPQFGSMPPMRIDTDRTYIATLKTSCGTIVVGLDAARAPETVNSFVFLARKGFFDGTRFHRLDTSIDVIQGGDPTGTGTGGPGYTIPNEASGAEKYTPGVVAMARGQDPNSGGSQFFIVTGPKGKTLPPDYTIFGRVIEGLDVAQRIQDLPIRDPSAGFSGQQPRRPVYIEKVTITVSRT
ncbi:MAG: peptidylprolyl isomerase [Actinomycetota bacterium]